MSRCETRESRASNRAPPPPPLRSPRHLGTAEPLNGSRPNPPPWPVSGMRNAGREDESSSAFPNHERMLMRPPSHRAGYGAVGSQAWPMREESFGTEARLLAFDLGAESGRAILGRLEGRLALKDIYRFPNEPVRNNGSLHWDILRLWHEMRKGLELVSDISLASVGLDTWGCDYALLGETGNLLENPYHYRDPRTDGVQEEVFRRVSAERIYSVTGIQFLPFNTLFQLYTAKRSTPRLLDAATALVTIPDLLNYWLTGRLCSEFTNATTTQMVDARTRSWSTQLVSELGLPTRLLPADSRAWRRRRWGPRERLAVARRHAGSRAGLSRYRFGLRGGVHRWWRRVPQLGHVVVARR